MQPIVRQAGDRARELRIRYFPTCRIGGGFLVLVPWINLIMILFFYYTFAGKFVLQPGYRVELPYSLAVTGSRSDVMLVIRGIDGSSATPLREFVFFDNASFDVRNVQHMARLKTRLAERSVRRGQTTATIFADDKVPFSTLSRVMTLASEVGIRNINMATRIIEPVSHASP
jgi:biopolymer transport protein ExbD